MLALQSHANSARLALAVSLGLMSNFRAVRRRPRFAAGVTQLADVIIPSRFTSYVQQLTTQKSALVQSGVLEQDPVLAEFLAGAGLTLNAPSFKDLDNDADVVSTDNPASSSSPNKLGSSLEIAVRLSRNNSWSSMDLTAALIGADPMQAIANRVGYYWTRRLQAAFVATMNGIFKDNAAAPSGSDAHLQNDMTVDIRGGGYAAGVTDFSAEAFIDACLTMGDSADEIVAVMVHSLVYGRMQKNNLIDFIPDARGEVQIPTFLGRRVIVDDGVPIVSTGIYESWLFGRGAVRFGQASPKVPTEVDRKPAAGDGGGQDVLHNRVEWCIHPKGNAYIGTAPSGGPSNGTSTHDLNIATSWSRRWPERKQIKIARLITREA